MKLNIFAAALLLGAAPVAAQTVDGQNTGGSEYSGGSTAVVETNAAAPDSNFGAPTNQGTIGYNINLLDTNGSLYGLVTQTGGPSAFFTGSNLYFDLDPATRSGSDLGFEISLGGVNAFIPGVTGSVSLASALFAVASTTSDGLTTLEFSLDNSLFNSAIAGLSYNPAVTFSGDNRLNLSQSLSYSVAGGQAFYGTARLGTFSTAAVAGAVPEPATWAMMLLGFGAMSVSLRRRRRAHSSLQSA